MAVLIPVTIRAGRRIHRRTLSTRGGGLSTRTVSPWWALPAPSCAPALC